MLREQGMSTLINRPLVATSATCSTGSRAPSPHVSLSQADASWTQGPCSYFCLPPQCVGWPQRALTTGLHADQLQLYALDGSLRALHHQLPCQWLCDHAIGGVEMPSDEKFGEQGSLEQHKNKTSGMEGAEGNHSRVNQLVQTKTENKVGQFL